MKYGNFKSLTVDPKLNVYIDTSTLNMIFVTNSFIIFSLKSNGAFTRSRVLCICPRPFPFSPPSWQFWSRTAWLSWAGRPIGRGPADAPPVSAAASRRRPGEARGRPCPTRAGSWGSSPRPRPGRETWRFNRGDGEFEMMNYSSRNGCKCKHLATAFQDDAIYRTVVVYFWFETHIK